MLLELASSIHPDHSVERIFVVITYKFDESYNSRSFIVGGWICGEKQWTKIHKQWHKAIAYENRTLPEGRKLTRYHATEMNGNYGEYEGWENEGYRKLRFTKKLLKILTSSKLLTAIAVGLDLKSFLEKFPRRDPPDLCVAYIICFQQLMFLIGEAMRQFKPDVRVALVHEHNDWDTQILEAFNKIIDDPEFPDRERFVSVTPMYWHSDTGLQGADLIAYETMRALDNELWTDVDLRKVMKELLRMNQGGVFAKYIDRQALEEFGRSLDERTKETV